MSHVNPAHAETLAGRDVKPDDPALTQYLRIEAAWAKAHDLAEERFGQASVFFSEHGAALVKAMETAAAGTSAADLVKLAEAAIDKVKPKPVPKAAPVKAEPVKVPGAKA